MEQKSYTIPLVLTFLRIAFLPIFVISYYIPFHWAQILMIIIFILAAFTDWLDGFIARKIRQTSDFGAFLDPVADKLITIIALVLLVSSFKTIWITIPALIIIGREIIVSALRQWMAEIGHRKKVKVNIVGKSKTAIQFIAIALLLFYDPKEGNNLIIFSGFVFLYIALALTVWSMIIYIKNSKPYLKAKQS